MKNIRALKSTMPQSGIGLAFVILLTQTMFRFSDSVTKIRRSCPLTTHNRQVVFKIGVLLSKNDLTFPKAIQENLQASMATTCVNFYFVNFDVMSDFKIPREGWTRIEDVLISRSVTDRVDLDLLIGPYYTNVAMMMEQLNIPYLVTSNKGYEWIDKNRVNDYIQWKSTVDLLPPIREQNQAVVELFLEKAWSSAVMIMPEKDLDSEECTALAKQMTDASISLIPYSIETNTRKTTELIQMVLRNSDLQGQKQLIVCSSRDEHDRLIRKVLKQAKAFDLLNRDDVTFVLIDPTSTLGALSGSRLYRLGLFDAKCMILAFRFLEPDPDGEDPPDSVQLAAIDSAKVVQTAVEAYIRDNPARETVRPGHILRYFKEVQIDGETGWIQYNASGNRVNYTLFLYNHGRDKMFTKIGEWTPGNATGERIRFTKAMQLMDNGNKVGIFPKLVKIVVVLEEPFVIHRPGVWHGNDQYEGFTIDILHHLADTLNFKYEIYESPDNQYGSDDDLDEWDGMVKEVMLGNATLAMGAISITSKREEVIDFSLGIISTGINVLIPKPKEVFTIFQFVKPFSSYLWLAIFGSYLAASALLFILDYCNEDRNFTMKETLWFTIGTMLMRGTDFSPRSTSLRILTAGFTFFVLITVSTYTANMAAFLTTTNLEASVGSLDDLVQARHLNVLTVTNSATMGFLRKGSRVTYERLWRRIRNDGGLVANANDAVQKVKEGGNAFVFDYLINSFAELKHCTTKTVASPIMLQEHGIGMAAGAPFKGKIDHALLQLIEKGVIRKLRKRWWQDKAQCDINQGSKSSTQIEFDLKHMAGVFIVGLVGLGCSVAFFLFKKFYLLSRANNPKGAKKPDVDEKTSLRHESRKEKLKAFD